MLIQGPIKKIKKSEAELMKKEKDLIALLRPIQEELYSTCLKLQELRSTKETNEQNKDFSYSSSKEIVEELKGHLEKRRQLVFA